MKNMRSWKERERERERENDKERESLEYGSKGTTLSWRDGKSNGKGEEENENKDFL